MAQSQYATITDLQSLAITAAAAGRFGNVAMTAQLQAASAIMDSYLPSQFTLPLVSWDMSLTLNVCNVAAYLLNNQFGYAPSAPGDDMVVKRYESSISWGEQVRDKKIFPQFVDSSGVPLTQEAAGAFIVSDTPVGFTTRGLPSVGTSNPDPWAWNS